ncbi:MAG TPA: acetate--CoA ligase family protein, partial [Ochrobactrum intermedium]
TGMPFPSQSAPSGASLVSHSGSTWSGLVGNRRSIGFDYAISAGQELVTGVADYVDFLLDQPSTKVVACVIETLREPARFLQALEKADRKGIPIVVLKLGRSEIGQKFAISHSGAISGSAAVYEAVLRKHNVIQVRSLDELMDTVELFARSPRLALPSLALGTDSGGERQLIVDIATDIGLDFAPLEAATTVRVQALLDTGMEAANPLDYWGDGADVMAPTLSAMAEDAGVGMVVMAANMPGGRAFMHQCADAIISVKNGTSKPVALLGNVSSTIAPEGAARVRDAGIPVLMGTEPGLRAIKHFIDYSRRLPIEVETTSSSEKSAQTRGAALGDRTPGSLSSAEGFGLLGKRTIPVTPYAMIENVADIDAFVAANGYPVVLKIDDPAIPHKSDAGGVHINLRSREDVEAAMTRLKALHPDAPVMVQKQAAGRELILGMTTDPDFGPVVTLGLGGIYAEVFKDVVILPVPFGTREARAALESLKSYPILAGARGQKPVYIDKVVDAVVSFGQLSRDVEGVISEIEINPLLAGPDQVVAVDCLAVRTGA